MRGTLRLKFLSDTCFSMPASSDNTVDTSVAIDALGLPTVSGKTLHGLLRDTWRSAQDYVDTTGEHGRALLGATQRHSAHEQGLLRIGDALLEDGNIRRWVQWARNRAHRTSPKKDAELVAMLQEALLSRRILTAQDRETGAPKRDTLRLIRVVPKGMTLTASLETSAPLSEEQANLLHLLTRLTRHVGMDRNRGLGHVEMSLTWEDTEKEQTSAPREETTEVPSGPTLYLPFSLKLHAPCLVAERSLDTNSRAAKTYIPGSTLRGALAGALLRSAEATELDRVILSGKVRLLNAYIEGVERSRALPNPITWQRNKNAKWEKDTDSGTQPADALESLFLTEGETRAAGQRQPLKSPYYVHVGADYYPATVDVRKTTHRLGDPETGVTQKDRTTVFVYEALEAGQTFRGLLALPATEAVLGEKMAALLEKGPIWLGRSARSGYGAAARIRFDRETAVKPGHAPRFRQQWHEQGEAFCNIPKDGYFTVLLTSDAVLRDPVTGQHDPYRLKAEIAERFKGHGIVVEADLDTTVACVHTEVARGYNRLWRTDLPAVPSAAAGCVVLLQATQAISGKEIAALQSTPIGERIAEGFGCFVVRAELESTLSLKEEPKSANAEPAEAAPELLVQAQRSIYRDRLLLQRSNQALQLAEQVAEASLPSSSLLQRLREPLNHTEDWRTQYRAWFGAKQLRERALTPLQRCRVGTGSLAELLLAIAARTQNSILKAPNEADRTQYRLVSETQSQSVWAEEQIRAEVYFVDTLLGRLAKRARDRERRPARDVAVEERGNGGVR
jgi:CRISPR-associated protein Csx10